ncbi:MAG: 2-C-methyl-D-erythritol 4-phosphate cytidylyltransferase [Arsenophonus sp.]|nr:MAG: 2-C-methyl-D-erythritol 4-phosphate cytidylyltransferase [Arsenophonus sp.]
MYHRISHHKTQIVALVPAAGIGRRMQADYPKQYLKIAGKTIIEYTLLTLLQNSRISKIIVLLRENDIFFYKLAISKNSIIKTVIGGSQRSYSVLAGLHYLSNNVLLDSCWVLVHDAVRPCLHHSDLDNIINFIDTHQSSDGGILAIPVRDTIKCSIKGTININYTVDRSNLWHALTPQFFPLTLITNCLIQALEQKAIITDDASALEYCGYHPQLLEGRSDNLKVTQPEDLLLLEFYLSHRNE